MNKNAAIYISKSSIIRQQKGFEFLWKLESNLVFLDGHFPDRPILPAVSMIDICVEALSIFLERSVQIVSIKNAKYMEIIEPGHELKFDLEQRDEADNWIAQITNNKTNFVVCIIKLNIK